MLESLPSMLQGSMRREAIKRQGLSLRDRHDLRAVACAQVGIGYGPVEAPDHDYTDKDGNLVKVDATDRFFVDKMPNACLTVALVPATWEMLDNRDAIIRHYRHE